MVRLVAIDADLDAAERRRRSFGSWGSDVWMSDDFNELGDDLARAFGIDPEEERQNRKAIAKRVAANRKREAKKR